MKYVTVDGPTAIIKVEGIYGSSVVREVEDEFDKAQEMGCVELTYDFSKTKYIESTAVSSMTLRNRKIKNKAKITGANDVIMEALRSMDALTDYDFI